MTGSRLVPTLAALVLAGGTLCASDNIAPVITLPVDDAVLNPVTPIDALENINPAGLDLSSALGDEIYVYSASGSPHWNDLTTLGGLASAGIIIESFSGAGTWQRGAAGSWFAVNPGERMTLNGNSLRFLPDPAAGTSTAALTFRAWDGSSTPDLEDGTGSPTPYSSETRTLTYNVAAANDAPVIGGTTPADGSNQVMANGDSLSISAAATDADGDALTWSVSSRLLNNTFPPDSNLSLSYTSDGAPDEVVLTVSDGTTSSSFTVYVNNQSPVIVADPSMPYRVQVTDEGGTLDLGLYISASDPDGDAVTFPPASGSTGYTYGSYYYADGSSGHPVDSFTWYASDGISPDASVTVQVELNVIPVINDPNGHADGVVRVLPDHSVDLATLGITATDADGDTLTWSLAADSYTYYGSVSGSTYFAGSTDGVEEYVEFEVTDGYGGSSTIGIWFRTSTNDAPQLVSTTLTAGEGYYFDVRQGGSATFSITLDDPDGDTVTLDTQSEGYYLPSYGDLSAPVITNDIETGARTFTFTYDHDGATPYWYGDSMELVFSDGNGNEWSSYIWVSISQNNAPYLITNVPGIAVRGRPYSALITIQDDEADDPISLATSELPPSEVATASLPSGNLPAGALVEVGSTIVIGGQYSNTTQRTYRLAFIPDSAGLVEFSLTTSDGSVESTGTYYISVADPIAATVDEPQIPVSAPGSPIYAAVAPGSTNGWSSLMSALAPHGSDVARAWWWSTAGQGFADAEESPVSSARQPSAALFLASTVALTYSFDAKPYPMPFAIDLPPARQQATGAGRDGWTFFGVPALWDGESTWTEHTLDDFVIETADGQRVDSEGEILNALAPASDNVVQQPWSYDPALAAADRYQPAATLVAGHGYWIRNRSTTAYRLVRVASNDEAGGIRLSDIGNIQVGARPAAIVGFSASAAAEEKPPAPPSGSSGETSTAAAADGGSSCGVGGLAGLLAASLALLGIGSRRRA